MTFVDEQQCVFRKILEQCWRRFARQAASEKAAVILDPRAATRCSNHFQIKVRSLLEPLGFEQLSLGDQLFQSLGQLMPDRVHCLLHCRARRDVMTVGVDPHVVEHGRFFSRQRVELRNGFDFVAEERNPPGAVLVMRWKDLQIVAPNAEIAALERSLVPFVLERDKLSNDFRLLDRLTLFEVKYHCRVCLDRPDTVQARDRRHDDYVVAFEQ